MQIESWERVPEGILLSTDQGKVKIETRTPSIIRVVHTLHETFSQQPSLAVLPRSDTLRTWDAEQEGTTIRLWTERLQLSIDLRTGAITYLDARGAVLTQEPQAGGQTLSTVEVVKTLFDSVHEVHAEHGADGVRVRAREGRQIVDRVASRSRLAFTWTADEALYGLGSHDDGLMNLRGSQQYLYQQNTKAVVPMLVSTRGYGILMDGYSLITFHDDQHGSYLWSDVHDELDFYFIYGPEIDDIIAGYRHLTGPVPMLPKWAFGYIQSKERYTSQAELLAIVREYRTRRIPLDAIVQDWQSWAGDLWGQKSLDPARYPDPTAMVEELHGMHARLMVSIWPTMTNDSPNHKEMREQGYLLGNQATYNAFCEAARSLYWKQANEGLFVHGIDAWWCDCTEPFEADWRGEVKPEPEERLRINTEEARRYLDPEYINAYSLLHSRGIWDGQRGVTSAKRVVNLTRSSYAGQHRYGTITWSGDTAASWETLRRQIPAGLNFCVTGEPFWTLDIGGFFVAKRKQWFWDGHYEGGCDDLGYRELYVRWFQVAAFLPMFRAHGTDTPREVWRFGEPGSAFHDALVRFIHLRYRLLPYIYSVAGAVTRSAYTMLRALPFDFRHDPATFDIADQFMFGPALLVCPVLTPMYYGPGSTELQDVPRTRSVYLPTGSVWYDFWTGERFYGGQRLDVEAPLDRMPLFVRAGSILPLGRVVQHSAEPVDSIELRVFGGRDGHFVFYDDEGDTYNYEHGAYEIIPMTWEDETRVLTLADRIGTYATMPRTRIFVVYASEPAGDLSSGRNQREVRHLIEYDGRRVTVRLGRHEGAKE